MNAVNFSLEPPPSSAPYCSNFSTTSGMASTLLTSSFMRLTIAGFILAGPYACMLLADMGADVIKIEPPGSGDQTRGAMGFKMKGPDSLGFLNMNRNKRSVALNLKSEAGKAVLLRMVKDADILLENYRPGAMKRLGGSSRAGYRHPWPSAAAPPCLPRT